MSTNHWLRLWHDMPNDPKFRTVARLANEPISLVLSIYMHLLVDASRNVTRGHVCVTTEDLASALDVTEMQVQAVFDAMEGRLMVEKFLTGWDKRQPKKEDVGNEKTGAKSAAERKFAQRQREKEVREKAANASNVTDSHDASRNVTTEKRREEKRREEEGTQEMSRLSRNDDARFAEEDIHQNSQSPPKSAVGHITWVMRKEGIADGNTSNAKLEALIKAGATVEEFRAAAAKAVERRKGFLYALGIVESTRVEAKAMAEKLHQGTLPVAETTYQRSMRERMTEAVPEIAKPDPNVSQFFNQKLIEVSHEPAHRLG
jgi:hypothetical protein